MHSVVYRVVHRAMHKAQQTGEGGAAEREGRTRAQEGGKEQWEWEGGMPRTFLRPVQALTEGTGEGREMGKGRAREEGQTRAGGGQGARAERGGEGCEREGHADCSAPCTHREREQEEGHGQSTGGDVSW